jgi:hypothetical protein
MGHALKSRHASRACAGVLMVIVVAACSDSGADDALTAGGDSGSRGGTGPDGMAGSGGGSGSGGTVGSGGGTGSGGTVGSSGSEGGLGSTGVCRQPVSHSSETPTDLLVRGTALDSYDGQTARVFVHMHSRDIDDIGIGEVRIEEGAFELSFPRSQVSYTGVTVYVDTQLDDTCDTSDDPSGSITTGGVIGSDVIVDVCGELGPGCSRCPEARHCHYLELQVGAAKCWNGPYDLSSPIPCPAR